MQLKNLYQKPGHKNSITTVYLIEYCIRKKYFKENNHWPLATNNNADQMNASMDLFDD